MADLILKNGLIAYNEKRYNDALKYFKKLKDHKKEYYMGLAYVRLEDYKTAITFLKKYLKRETDYQLMIQVYFVLGFIYAQTKDFSKAKYYLEKALQLDFNNSKVFAALGFIHYKMRNFNESVKALKKAIEIDEGNATAHNSLGYIYADTNMNLEDAVKECEMALKLVPDYAAFLDSMGWAHFKKGDIKAAKKFLSEALDKLPDNKEVKKHFKDMIVKDIVKKKDKID